MKAGDKVVCVDEKNWRWPELTPKRPGAGKVYVIREIRISALNNSPVVHLIGIYGLPNPRTQLEQGFLITRFRPVAEVGHPPIEIHVMQPQEANT